MLYIASAQPPTPIVQSLHVENFTQPGTSSLLVAKPDRIEVWDVGPSGLVFQADLQVWGAVIGIEKVLVKDARPHILVLLGPPHAEILVLTYAHSPDRLVTTSHLSLHPPTPSLRHAEFFRGIVVENSTALISLWVGVLSCIELEVEKEKDLKRRRSSAVPPTATIHVISDKRLRIRDSFNVSVRDQNLLSLAFHAGPSTIHGPVVSMLSLSPRNEIELQFRGLSMTAQAFHDLGKEINVVLTPQSGLTVADEETNYGSIPFSCPGARHVVPAGTIGNERLALVIGDEYSVLYSFHPSGRDQGPVSSSSPATSPRASAVNRSPQSELKSIGKRRKSSMAEPGEQWHINPVWRARQGFGTILSATILVSNKSGGGVLLSDDSGRLTVFSWNFELDSNNDRTVRIGKADMGLSSPASSLTLLDSHHVFCASTCGDSTLLRLEIPPPGPPSSPLGPSSSPKSRKGKGKGREEASRSGSIIVCEPVMGSAKVLERWVNLAPVKDFCAVGDQSGGTSHLVVASGSSNANSLRLVRSGAGLEKIAAIEGIEGLERIWSLDLNNDGTSSLLISTDSSTSLLHMSPDVVEADLSTSIATTPTLAAAMISGSTITAIVTATAVSLWDDLSAEGALSTWQAPSEITSGQVSGEYIVLSTVGGTVHVLKASSTGIERFAYGNIGEEVSAVAMIWDANSTCPVVAVGTWSHRITVTDIESLEGLADSSATPITEAAYATSLMIRPTSQNDPTGFQLMAGLSDGSLAIYEFDWKRPIREYAKVKGDRKISSLGTQPLTLHPTLGHTASGGEILAMGLSDRASLIFLHKDRIDFSSVSTPGLVAAASIRSPGSYETSLVLATPSELSVSKVDGLKQLHIQTLDAASKSASKLVWMSTHRAIAAGVVERTIDQASGDYWQNACIELRDQDSLELLVSLPLGIREEVSSLAEVLLGEKRYIAVGTAVFPDDEQLDLVYEENANPAKEGRLILLDPVYDQSTSTWTLAQVAETKTIGAVNDIAIIHEFLAYAAASKVAILKFEDDVLTELSTFSSTFIAQSLFTAPPSKHQAEEKLIVGDGMRSVLMLEIDDESGMIYGDDRDMATHQVVALAGIKDRGQGLVVADGSSNILTFRLRDRIEPAATFGLHEQVVRFTSGAFAPSASAPDVIAPDLIFATSDGRLGMIGELSLPAAKIMDDLQRNLDKYQKSPSGLSWRQFRQGGKPLVPRETAGFIDGDFVQRFLEMDVGSGEAWEKVLKGGNVHEQITKFGLDGKLEGASRGDVARVLEAAAGFH